MERADNLTVQTTRPMEMQWTRCVASTPPRGWRSRGTPSGPSLFRSRLRNVWHFTS